MDNRDRSEQSLTTRVLRLREALEKVEELKLLQSQQRMQQLREEEMRTLSERDGLHKALTAPGSDERRSLFSHQLIAMGVRYEQRQIHSAEGHKAVELQQQRVQATYVESERWRSLDQTLSQRIAAVRQIEERRELDEAALARFRTEEGGETP